MTAIGGPGEGSPNDARDSVQAAISNPHVSLNEEGAGSRERVRGV